MTILFAKQEKNLKMSDQILLKGNDGSFEYFTVLLKESNKLKLQLKEALPIKRDDPELKRNIYSYPLEAFE